MYKTVAPILHALLLMILIGTFGSTVYIVRHEPSVPSLLPVPTAMQTAAPVPTAVPPTPQTLTTITDARDAANGGWSLLQRGLERRVIEIYNDQNQHIESLYLWRLDQKYFRMDVAYDETPKSLEAWQREMNANLVVNGGYYSIRNEKYFPDGLTIRDGKASGRSFTGFGGMLAINGSRAELRWLVEKPYNAYESLHAALQSFPMLVKPGRQLGFGPERENHVSARRTVLAQDKDGRILFIVAPKGYFTLHQLSAYLTDSDLNLDIAVNLDGGGSPGILVANPPELISPTRPLPFVILVYPR